MLYPEEIKDEKLPFTAEIIDGGIEFYVSNFRTHAMVGSGVKAKEKRIYEADFIRSPEGIIYRVFYHNIFLIQNIENLELYRFSKKTLRDFEIIGNKYSQPKLEKKFKKANEKRKRTPRTNYNCQVV